MGKSPDDIVGHKTIATGRLGPLGFPETRHEPLTRREADSMWERCKGEEERRAILMPGEQDAVRVLFDAYQRLKELGWRDAVYCPKDGSTFKVIEAGSTGFHDCSYSGEWPTGGWLTHGDGDLYPSRPILFKAFNYPVEITEITEEEGKPNATR